MTVERGPVNGQVTHEAAWHGGIASLTVEQPTRVRLETVDDFRMTLTIERHDADPIKISICEYHDQCMADFLEEPPDLG